MNDVAGFDRIAPYLKDPLVLIGFFLLLAFSFSRYLVKQGIIRPLPTTSGYLLLKAILLYGFIIAVLLIVLGFALRYQELATQHQNLNELGSLLRGVLDRRSSLPEETKIEIINRVLEAYRSGALSEEQVERLAEQLKISPTQAVNHIQEFKPAINQQTSDNRSWAGSDIPAQAEVSAGAHILGGAPRSDSAPAQYVEGPARNTEDRDLNTERGDPPANEGLSVPLLLRPFDLVDQKCSIKITSPSRGAAVDRLDLVSGTAELPTGYLIWVLVQYGSNDWKSLGVTAVGEGGKWNMSTAFEIRGRSPFDIGAVAASENTINDVKSKAGIFDTTLNNLGCAFVEVSLNKNLNSKQASCGGGRTVSCRAFRCDCEDNVGCTGYDSMGQVVENNPCPGLSLE